MNLAIHPTFCEPSWAVQSETEPTGDAVSDAEMVRAVRGGDTERFGVLVARHQGRLFGVARRYLRRDVEVADLGQDVLI